MTIPLLSRIGDLFFLFMHPIWAVGLSLINLTTWLTMPTLLGFIILCPYFMSDLKQRNVFKNRGYIFVALLLSRLVCPALQIPSYG